LSRGPNLSRPSPIKPLQQQQKMGVLKAAIAAAAAKQEALTAAKKAQVEATRAAKVAAGEAEAELKRKRAERFGVGESPSKKQKH